MYESLKFIHVLAVIAWVGSTIALAVFTGAAARREGRELAAVGRVAADLGGFFGATSGVALLAGIGMMFTSSAPEWSAPWISIGFVVYLVTVVLGARVIGPRYAAMAVAVDSGDDAGAVVARKAASVPVMVSLVLLAITVAAMVYKWGG